MSGCKFRTIKTKDEKPPLNTICNINDMTTNVYEYALNMNKKISVILTANTSFNTEIP
jgi:hypothetical protein